MKKSRKEWQKAIADLTQAIKLDSSYIDAYRMRGPLYANEKQYDKAISDMTEIVRLQPEDYSSYSQRALIYCSAGKKDLAEADFKKAEEIIAKGPNPSNRRNNEGALNLTRQLCG